MLFKNILVLFISQNIDQKIYSLIIVFIQFLETNIYNFYLKFDLFKSKYLSDWKMNWFYSPLNLFGSRNTAETEIRLDSM